jgi:hypothetical protein
MRNLYIVFLVLPLINACSGAQNLSMHKFDVLLGSWERIEGNSRFIEHWTKTNDNLYQGSSVEIIKGDTVFAENIDLIKKGSSIYYIVSFPTIATAPVSFQLVSTKPWTFENKENDFPQRIVYQRPVKDSLKAHIEGTSDGNFQKIEFPMKRIK